ncbi:MAG: hypothetical protein RIR76_2983 [Verrucomicrobiota bacterium]
MLASLSLPDSARFPAVPARPAGRPVMRQGWRDLLFLHWEVPVDVIRATLPYGLEPDTYGGRAFLGIVPFRMEGVRPAFLPAVPGLSDFPELNLRTYVRDRAGVPGVWFHSLDAGGRLAVAIARGFFHLPYHAARMEIRKDATAGAISFASRRCAGGGESRFEWRPGPALALPAAGSLEHFLVERYRLYAAGRGRLFRGAVAHPPYALRRVEVARCAESLFAAAGFTAPARAPDHAVCSDGVDVEVFGLDEIGREAVRPAIP